jgi:hypothetical protein
MYVGTATIGGLIYAVGGHDGVKRLKSVECYDVVNDCWLSVSPMGRFILRRSHTVALLGY